MNDEKQEKTMSYTPTVERLKRLRETAKDEIRRDSRSRVAWLDFTAYAQAHAVTLCETLEREKRELVEALSEPVHATSCNCSWCIRRRKLLAKHKDPQ